MFSIGTDVLLARLGNPTHEFNGLGTGASIARCQQRKLKIRVPVVQLRPWAPSLTLSGDFPRGI